MSFSWLNLKKSKNNSNLRSRFFTPDLMGLESRVNPVAFTGTVNLANSSVELLMTSTGVGANANNISISNISSTIIQVDAGAGNTIALTDGTSGNLIVSGGAPTQFATINLSTVQMAGFKLTGNVGDDLFTIGNFDGTALQTAANFDVLVDSSTIPGGSDTFTVNGALILKGSGSLATSNNANSSINLAQATVSATGSISTAGTGNVLLVANSLADSIVRVNNGGTITTTSGTVTLIATLTSNPLGTILLNGNAVTTNGGSINFNSNVVLGNATTINSGNSITANVTFSGKVDGADSLTVTSQGLISFIGDIGNTLMGNINISGGGTGLAVTGNVSAASLVTTTAINGNISFGGTQNYTSAALGLNLSTINNGNITLSGNVTLAANAPLQLSHSGKLSIGGNITNGVLNEVNVSPTSTIQLGINNSITLSMNQGISFNSPTTLGQNTTLVTGNGQGITFNSTLDGSRTLVLNTVGAVNFRDNVGSTSAVSQINTLTNNPSSLTFSEALTPGKTLNVGLLNATTTGDIILTVDQIYSAGGLTLTTIGSGNITLGSVVSNIGSVGSVIINNAGILNITKSITLDGIFSQTTAGGVTIGTLAGSPLVITTRNQDMIFTGAITLNTDLTLNAGTASTADMTLGVINSLGGNAFDLTLLAGGNLTFSGSLGNLTSLGAINTSFVTLSSLNMNSNVQVINAESLTTKVAGDLVINAAQTYSTALGLNIINTSSSNRTQIAAVTTTNNGIISITNAGILQLTGNITQPERSLSPEAEQYFLA